MWEGSIFEQRNTAEPFNNLNGGNYFLAVDFLQNPSSSITAAASASADSCKILQENDKLNI